MTALISSSLYGYPERGEIVKLSIAVSVVCIVFLFHLPSALVVILTLPIAIIMSSFACITWGHSNIMSFPVLPSHRRYGRRFDNHGRECPQEA
jgi:hypothetical protein